MGKIAAHRAISEYQTVNIDARVGEATPHRLVSMMLEGATSRINRAKGAVKRKEIALKGELISQSITIVDALRESLNLDEGGDLAENLWLLYEYITKRLVVANSKNSVDMLDECNGLLGQVREAWDQMPTELRVANRQELSSYALVQ